MSRRGFQMFSMCYFTYHHFDLLDVIYSVVWRCHFDSLSMSCRSHYQDHFDSVVVSLLSSFEFSSTN